MQIEAKAEIMSISNTQDDARKAHYQRIRGGFVTQGISLNAWCRLNGTHIQNVRDAFLGRWNGPQAVALVDKVAKAAGVKS